jgi:hypothetical protein
MRCSRPQAAGCAGRRCPLELAATSKAAFAFGQSPAAHRSTCRRPRRRERAGCLTVWSPDMSHMVAPTNNRRSTCYNYAGITGRRCQARPATWVQVPGPAAGRLRVVCYPPPTPCNLLPIACCGTWKHSARCIVRLRWSLHDTAAVGGWIIFRAPALQMNARSCQIGENGRGSLCCFSHVPVGTPDRHDPRRKNYGAAPVTPLCCAWAISEPQRVHACQARHQPGS